MVYGETISQVTTKDWGKTNSCFTLGKVTDGWRQKSRQGKKPLLFQHTKAKSFSSLSAPQLGGWVIVNPKMTVHHVTTGLAKEADADDKHRFSKTKPPFYFKTSSWKENTQLSKSNSEKVAKAKEASVEELKSPIKKDLFTNQNLSSKTSSLRLNSPETVRSWG